MTAAYRTDMHPHIKGERSKGMCGAVQSTHRAHLAAITSRCPSSASCASVALTKRFKPDFCLGITRKCTYEKSGGGGGEGRLLHKLRTAEALIFYALEESKRHDTCTYRCLWCNVSKSHALFILIDDVCGDGSVNQLVEKSGSVRVDCWVSGGGDGRFGYFVVRGHDFGK